MLRWGIYCGVIGLLLLQGCRSGEGPQLGTVTGVVTLDGKPLADAIISFTPDEAGRPSSGVTNREGRYQLEYSASQRGALVGSHRVHISTDQGGDNEGRKNQSSASSSREKVPDRYRGTESLTAVVKAGRNKIDFTLISE